MSDLLVIPIYILALIVFSVVFHSRWRGIKASFLAGLCAAFLTTSAYTALESRTINPVEYIGGFIWFGVTPAILGAVLSGLIGIPMQNRKPKA